MGNKLALQALELARTLSKGETRADVWRQLSHVTDRRLRQPLLDALAYDEHAKAREEAAETLADFLPDRGVEGALRAAMENDVDAGVRRQAAESLAALTRCGGYACNPEAPRRRGVRGASGGRNRIMGSG